MLRRGVGVRLRRERRARRRRRHGARRVRGEAHDYYNPGRTTLYSRYMIDCIYLIAINILYYSAVGHYIWRFGIPSNPHIGTQSYTTKTQVFIKKFIPYLDCIFLSNNRLIRFSLLLNNKSNSTVAYEIK